MQTAKLFVIERNILLNLADDDRESLAIEIIERGRRGQHPGHPPTEPADLFRHVGTDSSAIAVMGARILWQRQSATYARNRGVARTPSDGKPPLKKAFTDAAQTDIAIEI